MRNPRQIFATFCRRIRERHVVPWTLAYLAGAWIALESTSWLTEQYNWTPFLVPLLTIALGFGVLFAITVAWCHGAAGWQKVGRGEMIVYLILTAGMGAGLWAAGPRLVETVEARGAEVAPPPLTRIAILYLKDHHPSGDGRDLAADLTEGLTHHLAQVPALQVLPLQAAAPFRDSAVPLESILDGLRVGALVESSLTRLGDTAVVTVQLVSAAGEHLDSWTLDYPADPVSRLIRHAPPDVARLIRRRIGERVRQLEIEAATTSAQALQRYRQAEVILRREAVPMAHADWRAALRLLSEADSLLAESEAADPDWLHPILLRAEVADLRSRLSGGAGTRDLGALEEAIGHASRALAGGRIDAIALERRATLLFILAANSDAAQAADLYRQAETDMRAAVRMDPARPAAWAALSRLEARRGNYRTAYHFAETALAADSFLEHDMLILSRLGWSARSMGRLQLALEWSETGRRMDPGDQEPVQLRLMTLATLPHPTPTDLERAWAAADTMADLGLEARRAEWTSYGHMLVGTMLAGAGMRDSALAVMDRAGGVMRSGSTQMRAAAPLFQAHGHLRLGKREEALKLLREYVRIRPAEADALVFNFWFRELRQDPDFLAICCAAPERRPTR